jgi:hypothetical protein
MHPLHAHAKIDAYEQHLKSELEKVKAVRTLHPPPQQPGQPQKK